jgi:Na+-transporting NADH:ubiquinone oxidoreductase subunit F
VIIRKYEMDLPQPQSCTVTINNGYKNVSIKPGTSLLAGLARNGIFIPSACGGNARCGYCKVKVLSGGGIVTGPEEPLLSHEEKAAEMRLACQVKVRSDCAIEIPQHLFSVKRFSGKIAEKNLLTYDILLLRIDCVNPKSIEFTAGQYVQLKSMPYNGKEAVLRDFSISSPPSQQTGIELMIRRIPNGVFTPWAFDHLKVGDGISFTGPYGNFRASQNTDAQMVFIAGGSGMAPVWSILQDIREKKMMRPVCFFFGALTQKDLFLTEQLYGFEKELPDFKFIPALSNEPPESSWQGERGLITDVVARHMPDCRNHEAYLCGSPGMINACIKVLANRGMPEKNIFYDKFA